MLIAMYKACHLIGKQPYTFVWHCITAAENDIDMCSFQNSFKYEHRAMLLQQD